MRRGGKSHNRDPVSCSEGLLYVARQQEHKLLASNEESYTLKARHDRLPGPLTQKLFVLQMRDIHILKA